MRTTRSTAVAVATALLSGLLALLPGSAVPAGAAQTTFAMTTVRATDVDPATGRVFVSGDDKVEVFAANGTKIGAVTGLEGASGMDVEGGKLFVAETTAATISRVDTTTLAIDGTWTIGTTVAGSVAVIDGLVWLTTSGGSSTAVATLDPATGTVTPRGGSFYGGKIVEIPGRTDRMIVHDQGLSPYSVYNVDITGPTVAVLGDVPHGVGSNLREVAVNAAGNRFVTASGSPYQFTEFAYPAMAATGVIYQATNYPNGVDYTSAKGGVWVGSVQSNRLLYAYREGMPTPLVTHTTVSQILPSTVAVAPDATAVYAVTEGGDASRALEHFSLVPQITNALPGAVVAGVPTTVTIDGTGIGHVTSASVMGLPADVEVVSPTRVRLTMPTGVSPGARTISLLTPLGIATWPIEVQANTGGVLSGTVRNGGTPLTGIELSLSGGPLGTPRTTTSGGFGAYAFEGLPWSEAYVLEVHDPSGEHADQVISGITAEPNLTTGLDVDLSATAPPSDDNPLVSTIALPGAARDLVVHPGTGRTFVSAGDEVVAVDADGHLIGRIRAQWSAHGLALVGDDLFVNQRTGGAISRIDVHSLAVEAEHPTTTTTDGYLAHAGGRLWFTNGDNQWVGFASMDPTTGTVVIGTSSGVYVPGLGPIPGAPNRLMAWTRGLSPASVEIYDVTTTTPSFVVKNPHGSLSGSGPAAASAAANRVWAPGGKEFDLGSMQATGVTYPSSGGGVAHTAARGGLLAFGTKVSRQGAASAVATLGFTPQPDAMAFSPNGSRVIAGRSDVSELVTWDLAPMITSVAPATVVDDVPTSLTVAGHNLEGATSVTIQGLDAPWTTQPDGSLRVDVPTGVAPGTRTVVVTTLLGTDSSTFTVAVNTGATLQGTIRSADEPVAGVELSLSGGPLAEPVTTVSGADGSYAFTEQPYGTDYVLAAHDPSGDHVDQQVVSINLVPNDPTDVDVDLSSVDVPARSAARAEITLPGPAREVLVHPPTGRIVVSAGDEVLVADSDGHLVGRVLDQWSAHGMALVGDDLYVNQRTAKTVARIDVTDLAITGSWPTTTTTNGHLAHVGGKLWFTTTDNQWSGLAALDPLTGEVATFSGSYYNPGLSPVPGAPNRIFVWSQGISSGDVRLLDVSSGTPTQVAGGSTGGYNLGFDAVASNAAARVWTSTGKEMDLATLTATGAQYPSGGAAVAHTSAFGGLLAFGTALTAQGSTATISTIGVTPGQGALAFSAGGSDLAVGTSDARLVLWSLAPHVTAVEPSTVRPGSLDTAVTLRGFGLGLVTTATIDGTPVTVTPISPTELELVVPASLTDVDDPPAQLSVDLTSTLGTTVDAATITIGTNPPSAPTSVSAWWNGAAVHVQWVAPGDPGSSPITGYEVTVDGETTTVPASADSIALTGVSPGTHVVEVRAVSTDGASPAGTSGPVDVPTVPPSPPTGVILVGAPASATLSWSPPLVSGSGPVTGYEVRYGDLALSFQVPADQHTATLHPLTPGQPVWFAVRALSDAGPSAWTESAPAIPGIVDSLFTDVGWGHPFYWEILTAKTQGIASGYPDGTFRPGAVVSRQAAVAFLWRVAGEPTGHADPGFTDVGADHPFRTAIWWAASEGIVDGYPDGTFRGGASVTRQAWMAFQWRAEGEPPVPGGCTESFTDVGPTHPFRTPILWAACADITTGYPDGTFHPAATVTRQATIAFLVRPTWPQWAPIEP